MVASRLDSSDKSNRDAMNDPSPGHCSWSWLWSWIGKESSLHCVKRERGPSSLGMRKESFKGLWVFAEKNKAVDLISSRVKRGCSNHTYCFGLSRRGRGETEREERGGVV